MFWFLVLFLLTVLLWYFYTNTLQKGRPPGPIGIPILGYLPFIDPKKPYETFTQLSKKYGNIFSVQLGSIYTVVLCDANIIREALKKEELTGRAPLFVTHGIMGGYGLICAEGRLWKEHRKLAIEWLRKLGMQKFGTSRSDLERRMMVQINDCIRGFGELAAQSSPSDPRHILQHTLGNLMNDIVFGETYGEDNKTWTYLKNLQEEGVKYIGISGAVNFLPFLRFLPNNKNIIKFLLDGKTKTHKIYNDIIGKVQQTLDYSGSDGGKSTNIIECFLKEKSRRRDQLGDATTADDIFSDEQFRHVLADLFGAGVDTTLTTLRWFILYMAKNVDIQTKARNQLLNNCNNGPPTLEDFDNLSYVKACISETQRIRSVVPVGIPHGANIETQLCGFQIPKNAMIMPLQWAVHMDPELFPEPEQFDPTRFLDTSGQYVAPAAFIPFQTGKRMCLGDEIARMILYLFCGHILYNFQVELPTMTKYDMTGTCGITLTPPEYVVILKKRT